MGSVYIRDNVVYRGDSEVGRIKDGYFESEDKGIKIFSDFSERQLTGIVDGEEGVFRVGNMDQLDFVSNER